ILPSPEKAVCAARFPPGISSRERSFPVSTSQKRILESGQLRDASVWQSRERASGPKYWSSTVKDFICLPENAFQIRHDLSPLTEVIVLPSGEKLANSAGY